MDLGFSYEQVTGPKVNRDLFPSVNQGRNVGGSVQGFVVDFHDEKGRCIQTSETVGTLDELEPIINRTLLRYQ